MTASRMYTMKEAAEILGVPYSTLCEQARKGQVDRLKPLRIGKHTVFPKRTLDDLTEGAA